MKLTFLGAADTVTGFMPPVDGGLNQCLLF